ncbi:hypothetical protein [Baekduia soli]|uniref:hypothetical protein n=1 Tax=Baekduia soli TaxID=496014 RepID=UPI001651B685|nr:hypothetical protein [Baekduia soli]
MTALTACRYGVQHDAVQPVGEHPSHNDSVYFNVAGPDGSGLAGAILRIGLRPNEGYGEASLVLPLTGGAGVVFHYARSPLEAAAVVPGSPAWASGPMRLEAEQATRRWRLRWAGGGARLLADPPAFGVAPGATWRAAAPVAVELDLRWDAELPMHCLSPAGDLIPGGRDVAYGRNHYEQFGRAIGTLRLGDRTIALDGAPAFRDHSWGPRVWDSAPDQDFACVQLADGRRIVAFANRADGAEDFHGVLWIPGAAQPLALDGYAIRTSYDGGPALEGGVGWTLRAGGEELVLEGDVLGYLPLRVGDRGVRIAQALLRLRGAAPGWAKVDLTRPSAGPGG